MKFNRVLEERETFDSRIMMLSPCCRYGKRYRWRNASGAFTASTAMMDLLSDNPKLGHTTLGTPCHCVSLSGYLAGNYRNRPDAQNLDKESLFKSLLVHPLIQEVRGKG
jgi:hypothetical protein